VANRKSIIYRVIFVAIFLIYCGLGLFSVYWLDEVTEHPIGSDFSIYYLAYMDAKIGDNPYLPYDIGTSYVYHPFALTFLSLFSARQSEVATLRYWILGGVLAWVGTLWLMARMATSNFWDGRNVSLNGSHLVRILLLAFLAFGPLWETWHTGQINTFVVFFLYFSFYLSETNRDIAAGVSLALAGVLKTSPLLFLAYFFVIGRYRVILSTCVTLVVLTLIPAVQFSPRVVWDFLTILPSMGTEIHPTAYNQSILSLVFRFVKNLGYANWGSGLVLGHKVLFAGLLLSLLGAVWLVKERSKALRFWLFCALVTAMTFFSPLVWYHHSVFLVLPLGALLCYNSKATQFLSVAILFLLQLNRLFEYGVVRAAIPVLLAHSVLICGIIIIFFREWRRLYHVRRSQPMVSET